MSLILFGFKSSGKTYFGRLLSEKLQKEFIDTDVLVEKMYETRKNKKLSCREIFQKKGEDFFRSLEREVVLSLMEQRDVILSLGGGTILDEVNYDILKIMGKLVYLEVPRKMIEERIFAKEIPAFLNPSDIKGSFEQIYEKRASLYETREAIKIQIEGKTDLDVLKDLAEIWNGQ